MHDAEVATMLVHGIRRLLTHNLADFAPFTDIEVVDASTALPAEDEGQDEP